ncbi:hypothetical protein BDV06DRAFT_223437 [Aspergillus oleicola]
MPPFSSNNTPHLIAMGITSVIYALDETKFLKRRPKPNLLDDFAQKAFVIEINAYRRLGSHQRITMLLDVWDEGIIPERGNVHDKSSKAAQGLSYVYERGIVQADVGCHNLTLTNSGIKAIDFAGSSIDGQDALVCYDWCAARPELSRSGMFPYLKSDILALGSALFEIELWKVPFADLLQGQSLADVDVWALSRAAEGRFARREYPRKLERLVLGNVIRGCWEGVYGSMRAVVSAIERVSEGLGWES